MDEDLHDALDKVLKQFPTIDIVVNNAGKLVNKPFLELKREDINECYQTNAVGVMHATQYMVPKMIEKGGHIVNISTMGAFQDRKSTRLNSSHVRISYAVFCL